MTIGEISKQKHRRTANVRRQIFLSFWIKALSVILGLMLVPLLIDSLSTERYAIWLTLTSTFAWFSFFDFGLGNGLRNKLTESMALGKRRLAKEYVSTAYGVTTVIFSSISIIFWVVNAYIDWQSILNVKSINNTELRTLACIIFSLVMMRFVLQLVGVVYVAMQRTAMNNAIATLGNLLAFMGILCAHQLGSRDLLIYSVLLAGIPVLVQLIWTLLVFGTTYDYLRPSFSAISLEHVKILFNLGGLFFLIQISAIVLFSSANILIIQEFDPAEVVIYSAALTYFQLPVVVYGIVMAPLWSAVTEAYIQNDLKWMKSSLLILNRISIVFVIGIFFQALLSPFIYRLWLGDRVSIPFAITAAMSLYAIVNVILAPFSSFINGTGKIQLSAAIAVLSIVAYFPLAIYLARTFDSSAGIMLATCLVNGVGLYFQPKQVAKILAGSATGIWGR